VRFAHLADCHLGGWREPKLRDANGRAFVMVVDMILTSRVDFVLIAGDLFNTSMPSIDALRLAVEQLKRFKDVGIPVYAIAGSHDFSPSGKTMLDVLDRAGLLVNVFKGAVVDGKLSLEFTIDEKTGVKLTGMIGKKGGLDKALYDGLIRDHLETESGTKIFLFHCSLAEVKPKELEDMDAMPVSYLPRGFIYYAGGHVHVRDNASVGGLANIVYPGPTYPNNLAELEKLRHGSFVLYEDGKVTHVPIEPHRVVPVHLEACRSAVETEAALAKILAGVDVTDAIVTLRVRGTLSEGKPSDIPFEAISQSLVERGAFAVLRNTAHLSSKEFTEIKVKEGTVEDVERELIASQKERRDLIPQLMSALASQKDEGEKVVDFERRVRSDVDALLGWVGKF